MQMTRLVFAGLLLALPLLSGCSKPPADSAPTAPTVTAAAVESPVAPVRATPSREDAKACDLVTAQEMSAILGSVVSGAEPGHKSSGVTACVYQPTGGTSPYVEFSVEWGEGKLALMAAGAMGKAESGIGDQAMAVGPTLWIRSGEDLVKIVFSGVDDRPAKARKIFDTAKARM